MTTIFDETKSTMQNDINSFCIEQAVKILPSSSKDEVIELSKELEEYIKGGWSYTNSVSNS